MNHQQGVGWFAAPNKIFGDSQLSALDKLVLLYLTRCAGPDGSCWPGRRRIAEDCGLCEKTVSTCLANLRELGKITVERRISESGSDTSNLYRLNYGNDVRPPVTDTRGGGKRYQGEGVTDTHEGNLYEGNLEKESPLPPKRGKAPAALPPIPEDLLPIRTALESFIEHRKEIKHPMTARALELVFAKARKWGFARTLQSIEDSIQGGYQGLFEPRRVSDITGPQLSREERRRLTS